MQKFGVCGICQTTGVELETYHGYPPCDCDEDECESCSDRMRSGGLVLASHLVSGQPCEGAGMKPEAILPD